MSVTIKPLEDRILVQTLEAEQTTASGLVIPDTAKEKPQEGKVIAVGPGKTTDEGKVIPMPIKVGDKVLFSKYGPNEIKIPADRMGGEEKELLIAREDDILAIIE